MYKNQILNNLFAEHSDPDSIIFNMPYVETFVPNVSGESMYNDALETVFAFVSKMKLDIEFIQTYSQHLNVLDVIEANGLSVDIQRAFVDSIPTTVFHQFLHSSDSFLKFVTENTSDDTDLTPMFANLTSVYNEMYQTVTEKGEMVFGGHLVDLNTLDQFAEALSFFAHINIRFLDKSFVTVMTPTLFDPIQVYLLKDYFTETDLREVIETGYFIEAEELLGAIETYSEQDPDGNFLTDEKERVLTELAKDALITRLEEMV